MTYTDFFKDKTVTLMGLGLLGRGIGDAAFLAQHCKKLYVTDMKTAAELHTSLDALKAFTNIEFVLGGHDMKLFADKDFIVKGAGVRLDNPYIAEAKKNGIPVYTRKALFAYLAPIKIVGVTGTRGKTTTTCMIADILKRAGKKVLLGGNLRGVSTMGQLPEAANYDCAVLELDSWQLQGFDSLNISPNVSVFTTIYPDHMNYYDGDMDRYFEDKASIYRHQKPGHTIVLSPQVASFLDAHGNLTKPSSICIIAPPLSESFKLAIPGGHNLQNASLAKAAAKACGVDDSTIDAALTAFEGIEGRLQYVGAAQGRKFYNDSNATTQEATLAALKAFSADQTVLIFGGADKGLPIDTLSSYIADNKIRAVLIKGSGTDRVLKLLPNVPVVGSMSDAVAWAVNASKESDNIILSPGFASFGVFKNEYDRSDQYMAEVKKRVDSCQR